ncbi:hypothetical protein [Collimonas sp.]|jgi:hypothetical protein|uniref:hypothetical protein n=1 Tax=Collimonas sp. TaxID=1963772 RepID=UPI002CD13B9E|nr:hypothetical protein [Collimonas sp.]HWW07587.1 hypothetical protein [Collimonas sp.]
MRWQRVTANAFGNAIAEQVAAESTSKTFAQDVAERKTVTDPYGMLGRNQAAAPAEA